MNKFLTSVAVIALAAGTAEAQQEDRWYGGIQGGGGLSNTNTIEPIGTGVSAEVEKEFGPMAGAFVGRKINKWRFEFEYTFRANDQDNLELTGPGFAPGPPPFVTFIDEAGNSQTSHAFMINAHRELFELSGWKGIAGLGIGVARLEVAELGTPDTLFIDDAEWDLAAQGMFQVARNITDNLELGVGYRYFRTRRSDFETSLGTADFRFQNHEFLARLSWFFGGSKKAARPAPPPPPPPPPQAAPAPPPAPAPAPPPPPPPPPLPGPFLVYFDFDQAAITPAAGDIIKSAAKAYRDFNAVRVNATGHTDRAGANAYNDRLALRRAEAVKARLISEGVPESDIRIVSRGEEDPAVRTGDGVREDDNRRVEIVLTR